MGASGFAMPEHAAQKWKRFCENSTRQNKEIEHGFVSVETKRALRDFRPHSLITRLALLLVLNLLAALPTLAQVTPPPVTPPSPSIEAPAFDMNKPSADASGGQLRKVEPRPVLRLRAQSTWDDSFTSIKGVVAQLEEEAKRLGLATIEKPMAHFIDSDDLGFTYEAFLLLGAPAASGLAHGPGIEIAQSPSGRAMVFAHEGAYDEIDAAYEAITAWLDEKGLSATGKFLEEYLALPEKADDPGMKLNIYVFLK